MPGGLTHGLITVCRWSRRFGDDAREVVRSLAARATLILDAGGSLQITANVGAAAACAGPKNLSSPLPTALYAARRGGKNQTAKAQTQTANAFGGE